jgi:hypothetical protein
VASGSLGHHISGKTFSEKTVLRAVTGNRTPDVRFVSSPIYEYTNKVSPVLKVQNFNVAIRGLVLEIHFFRTGFY